MCLVLTHLYNPLRSRRRSTTGSSRPTTPSRSSSSPTSGSTTRKHSSTSVGCSRSTPTPSSLHSPSSSAATSQAYPVQSVERPVSPNTPVRHFDPPDACRPCSLLTSILSSASLRELPSPLKSPRHLPLPPLLLQLHLRPRSTRPLVLLHPSPPRNSKFVRLQAARSDPEREIRQQPVQAQVL